MGSDPQGPTNGHGGEVRGRVNAYVVISDRKSIDIDCLSSRYACLLRILSINHHIYVTSSSDDYFEQKSITLIDIDRPRDTVFVIPLQESIISIKISWSFDTVHLL